jgi:hypothetical protein
MYVLIFSTDLSKTFLIPRTIQRDLSTNGHTSSCNLPVVSCRILEKLEFSRQIFKEYSHIEFQANLGAEFCMRANRWTDGQT